MHGRPAAPLTWVQRLRGVFGIEITVCPFRGGRLRVIAGELSLRIYRFRGLLHHAGEKRTPRPGPRSIDGCAPGGLSTPESGHMTRSWPAQGAGHGSAINAPGRTLHCPGRRRDGGRTPRSRAR